MIVYLEKQDATVDVPDDISSDDLLNISENFYPESTPSQQLEQPTQTETKPKEEYKQNFYNGFIDPLINAVGGPMALPFQASSTPEDTAFTGKAVEEMTYGLSRYVMPEEVKKIYEENPYSAMAGKAAGAIGSLIATGKLLPMGAIESFGQKLARPIVAAGADTVVAKAAASAPRFIVPTIRNFSTFGTKTFIDKTVESAQNGEIDLVEFGESVLKSATLGGIFGGISGISNAPTAIASAGGMGYLYAKSEGADNPDAILNAVVWATFEAVGQIGKTVLLRRQAINTLKETIADFASKKNPNLSPDQARSVGNIIVEAEASKVGGTEAIVNRGQKDTLELIEAINQRIIKSKLKTPTGLIEAKPSAEPSTQPLLPTEPILPKEPIQPRPSEPVFNDTENIFYEKTQGGREQVYSSSKAGKRNFGELADEKAKLTKQLGGLEYIQKVPSPELVDLAKTLTGRVPDVLKTMKSLGYFKPSNQQIALLSELAKDTRLFSAVLAHEIGHANDFLPDKTMARGNILGSIITELKYRHETAPGEPGGEPIISEAEKAAFRQEAEIRSKKLSGELPQEQDFEPQAILGVWNNIESTSDKNLTDYIKGLSADDKKSLVKKAMQAMKRGESVTIKDINKFNKDAIKNPKKVSDIYADIIREEIKKRKLIENEVIKDELKKLTQYWKPFNESQSESFTKYRYNSRELYADFISVLLNAPGKAKEIAPSTYNAFFNYIERKPEFLNELIRIQTLLQGDKDLLQSLRIENIHKMYANGEMAFRERQIKLMEAEKSIWKKLELILFDKQATVLDVNEQFLKNNRVEPKDNIEYELGKQGMVPIIARSHVEDFNKDVYVPAKDNDVLEAVKDILFLERVQAPKELGGRAELANPLGHNPETVKEALDYMQKVNPDKFKMATELADKARNWLKNLSDIPGAEHLFTPEQRSIIKMGDKYAPYRVSKYARDWMSINYPNQFGTLEEINDPLTSIAMKGVATIYAIVRNELARETGEMITKTIPEVRTAEVKTYPSFHIKDPNEKWMGTLKWKENGKWKAIYTDKTIADLFSYNKTSSEISEAAGIINTLFLNNLFRRLWINFNPGFTSSNMQRDFFATWANLPGMTMKNLAEYYKKAKPHAVARSKGEYDALINEMERAGALQMTYNDMILDRSDEDSEIESIFKRLDIVNDPKSKYEGIPVLDQASKILDGIRYVNDIVETIPKVVAWMYLEDQGYPMEVRSHYVRNYAGTPNPKRAGTLSPLLNQVFMFSTIKINALRRMYELGFKQENNKAEFWRKRLLLAGMSNIWQYLAGAGLIGASVSQRKKIKQIMDSMSEYMMSNHMIVPIGLDSNGFGWAIRFALDDETRTMKSLMWKTMFLDKNAEKKMMEIFDFGAGELPGISPTPKIVSNWIQFFTGGKPRDYFKQMDIVNDREREAGGMYAMEPMIRWTINELGLMKLDVHDRLADEPVYKSIISAIPILNRMLVISNTGIKEKALQAGEDVRKEQARESLDMQEMINKAVKEGKPLKDIQAKDYEEYKKISGAYKRAQSKLVNDPYAKSLMAAKSTKEKLEILKYIKTQMGENEFSDFKKSLVNNGVISIDVWTKSR